MGATAEAWATRREAVCDDVYAHPGTAPGMIAVRVGIDSMALSRVLRRLERDGAVRRHPTMGQCVRVWPADVVGGEGNG